MSTVPYFKAMAWTRAAGAGVAFGGDDVEQKTFAPWEGEEAVAWARAMAEELMISGRGSWAMAHVSYVNSLGQGSMAWERYSVLSGTTGEVIELFTDGRRDWSAA